MNNQTSVPVEMTIDIEDISMLPEIKRAIKMLKGVLGVSTSKKKKQSVSPSNDKWFDDPNNIAMLELAIEESKTDKGREYSMDEIRSALGV